MGYFNVSGLNSGKIADDRISQLIRDHDILCFAETWRDAAEAETIKVEGYECYVKSAEKKRIKGRKSGGIMVFVKKYLHASVKRVHPDSPAVWLLLEYSHYQCAFGFLYNPPMGSNFVADSVFDELEADVERWRDQGIEDVSIFGDFNCRIGEIDDRVADGEPDERIDDVLPSFYDRNPDVPARRSRDQVVPELIQFLKASSMILLNGRKSGDENGEFTFLSHVGNSTIDMCATTYSAYVRYNSFEVIYDTFDSDHAPITSHYETPACPPKPPSPVKGNAPHGSTVHVKKVKWSREEGNAFVERFARIYHFVFILCNMYLSQGNLRRCVDSLTDLLWHSASHMKLKEKRPSSSTQKVRAPWFDALCSAAKKAWRKAVKSLRKTWSQENLDNVKEKRSEYKRTRKQAITAYKEREKAELLSLRREQRPKELWAKVRKYVKPYTKVDEKITGREWVNYFDKLLNSEHRQGRVEWTIPPTEDNDQNRTHVMDPILDEEITSTEVESSIRQTKTGKAGGVDGLCGEMIKGVGGFLLALLSRLFTWMLERGYYPAQWGNSIICPIYKGKGKKDEPGSYRGIALLSCLGKVFTRILNARLNFWLLVHNTITEEQAGFRAGYSTMDQVYILNTLVTSQLHQGKKLYVALVDFQKAFDSIHRSALWFKLYNIGVRGKFLRMIMAMYSVCSFSVRLTLQLVTAPTRATCGVYQGCILSPTLFSIFVNDIPEFFRDQRRGFDAPKLGNQVVNTLLFADDLILMSTSPEGLQRQLNRLAQYADYWMLQVNTSKTQVIVFRNGGRLAAKEKWAYQGVPLTVESKVRYLGVWFTPKAVWTTHVETATGQARKALFLLRRLIYGAPNLPLGFLWHLFDVLISPIVLYGAEVWGVGRNSHDLNRLETRFAKTILKLPISTSSTGVMLELNRALSLRWKARLRAVRYWVKVLDMPRTRYVKQAYEVQRQLARDGVCCWASGVRDVLFELDFTEVWELEDPGARRGFLRQLEARAEALAHGELLMEAQERKSLNFLRRYKIGKGMDVDLMSMNSEKRRRVLLGRLKCVTFATYRFREGTRTKFCTLCDKVVPSDEWDHVLWECKAVEDERLKMNLGEKECDDTCGKPLFTPHLYEPLSEFLKICLAKRNEKRNR